MGCCIIKQAVVPMKVSTSQFNIKQFGEMQKYMPKMKVIKLEQTKELEKNSVKVVNSYWTTNENGNDLTKDSLRSPCQKLSLLYQNLSQPLKNRLNNIRQNIIKTSNKGVEDYVELVRQLMAQSETSKAEELIIKLLDVSQTSIYTELNAQTQDEIYLLQLISEMLASKSKRYRIYLERLNKIYNAFPEYFIENRISLINNVAVNIQTSDRRGRFTQTIQLFEQVIKLQRKYLLKKDKRIYYTRCNIAGVYYENKQPEKGKELFVNLIEQLSKESFQGITQLRQHVNSNYNYYHKSSIIDSEIKRNQ